MISKNLQTAIDSIGVEGLPDSLVEHQVELASIFAKQISDGHERSANPYFTNDRGHNVGFDVLNAASCAAKQLRALPDEAVIRSLARLMAKLELASFAFKKLHSDPDGYGAATFGEIERDLSALAARLSIDTDRADFKILKSEIGEEERDKRHRGH